MNIEAPRDQLDRRQILTALRAFRRGDFSVRLQNTYDGIDSEVADTFNEIVELNDQLAREFERLSRVVGKDGRIGKRGHVRNATGSWEFERSIGQRPDRGHGAAHCRSGPRNRGGRQRRPVTDHDGRDRRLGLSTVYGFARQSGGTLQISREVGRGTQMEIWLPQSASDPVPANQIDVPRECANAGKTTSNRSSCSWTIAPA